MPADGLVLFAHGARDARWAEPFAAVAARIQARRPDLAVVLAFLEHMAPDLPAALADLEGRGVTRVRVVPLFFGRGGHLRDDFPHILEAARRKSPRLVVEVTPAAGEDEAVQEALADFALRAPQGG
jgi:sirohydrochlorin cobaltochelatase